MLYVYPCEWNYRADFCMYGSVCKTAETAGAMVLHGNRQYFHNDKQPTFKAVYQTLRDVSHTTDRTYAFRCSVYANHDILFL